ncbi:MAG: hypothetical protein R2788_21630 [Saprospiraceae bacterium]
MFTIKYFEKKINIAHFKAILANRDGFPFASYFYWCFWEKTSAQSIFDQKVSIVVSK